MKRLSILSGRGKAGYLLPFILVTSCFALWGFANDITNPMVKAFSKIFRMSASEGALVQLAFYGGYFAMAFPAAMFIRRYSYKAGVLMGLALYASGAFLFFPAKLSGGYYAFLAAYFVLTCGLSFLETSCNPYILAMGSPESATRRLNLAQAFNPMGSLLGMWVAMTFIQARLDPAGTADRALMDDAQFAAVKAHDLGVLIGPYLFIGAVILVMMAVIYFTRMPSVGESACAASSRRVVDSGLAAVMKRLWRMRGYREGVIAQFFYVGAQIMCWTFIIQYGTGVFMAEGMDEQSAEIMSQRYNIGAMILFCCSRFVCTYFLRYVNAGRLLMILAAVGVALTLGVIFMSGRAGLLCLVAVSGCMSLMFPTIYGLALTGVGGDDAKFGAAGLIMSILGGSVLPPLQGAVIDLGSIAGFPAVNLSFVLPLVCFAVVVVYGMRTR